MSDLPSRLHFVNVGPQGTFRPAGKVSTSPTDIDAILDHVRTSDVSRSRSTSTAASLVKLGLVSSQPLGTSMRLGPPWFDRVHLLGGGCE
jgi:hypothetical protein